MSKEVVTVKEPEQGKRGLLDGIGLITHHLFGIATDAEVEEVRKHVEENRAALRQANHSKSHNGSGRNKQHFLYKCVS
jgi:hypothetical protein